MMIHFRDCIRDLHRVEPTMAQTEFQTFLKERFFLSFDSRGQLVRIVHKGL